MGFLLILHTAITEWEMIYQAGLLLHLMFALSRSMMTSGLKKSGIRKFSNGKSFTNQKSVKRLLVIPMSFTFIMMQPEKMAQSLAPLLITIPQYGPFSLSEKATFVPALDYAIPGMCLGERRMVSVPPRLGWAGGHHDTIMVELMLVKINGIEAEQFAPEGPPKVEL